MVRPKEMEPTVGSETTELVAIENVAGSKETKSKPTKGYHVGASAPGIFPTLN